MPFPAYGGSDTPRNGCANLDKGMLWENANAFRLPTASRAAAPPLAFKNCLRFMMSPPPQSQ